MGNVFEHTADMERGPIVYDCPGSARVARYGGAKLLTLGQTAQVISEQRKFNIERNTGYVEYSV